MALIPYRTVTFESILCLAVDLYTNPWFLRPGLLCGERLEDLGGFSFKPFYVGVCGSQARKHYVCQLLTRCQSQEKSHLFKTSPGSSGTSRQVRKKYFSIREILHVVKMLETIHNYFDGNWSTFLAEIFLHFFLLRHILNELISLDEACSPSICELRI